MDNTQILNSVLKTLETIEVHGKEACTRMVACMNAIEHVIMASENPAPEPAPASKEESVNGK